MIYYREWVVPIEDRLTWLSNQQKYYKFTGWFFLGIIPLYIKRSGF